MNWIKNLIWDSDLGLMDNLATWAVAIIGFTGFYIFLLLVLILGEQP